jgi:hypothetical protein
VDIKQYGAEGSVLVVALPAMASRPQAPSNQPTAGTIKSYSIKVGNAEARQRQYFCGRFDTKKPTWLRTGGTHEPTVAKETLDNWEKRGARTAGMFAARVKVCFSSSNIRQLL